MKNKTIKEKINKILNIEKDFFDIDEDKKEANIQLQFKKVSDVFDKNYVSKKPIFSDDFLDWIKSVFELIPNKYRINLDVNFNDMEGYTKEELKTYFDLNIIYEYKNIKAKKNRKDKIANGFIVIGIVMFCSMLLINNLWTDNNLLKQIFTYIADIATTVTFWEAMTILVVENKETSSYMKNLFSRFKSIEFHQNGKNSEKESK